MSLDELLAALKKHQARLPRLQSKARKLQKQLAAVETEIAALGGVVSGVRGAAGRRRPTGLRRRPRKRPRNRVTLAEALVNVLSKDKASSVSQITADVQAAGYKSTSENFATIIYQTLSRDKRVKRVGRGLYQLKG